MNNKIFLMASLIVFTACAKQQKIDDDINEIKSQIDEYIHTVRVPEKKLKKIKYPKNASWLNSEFNAYYNNISAKDAINLILQERPVHFGFDINKVNNIIVQPPKNSTLLLDHLNAICTQANWSYQFENEVLIISDIETRAFFINASPGQNTINVPFRSLASSTGSGGGGVKNDVNVVLDPYAGNLPDIVRSLIGAGEEELESSQETFLAVSGASPSGYNDENTSANVSQNKSDNRLSVNFIEQANILMVTARPNDLVRVQEIVDIINDSTSKTVLIEIVAYEVDVSNRKTRSLDINALRTNDNSFGLSIDGTAIAGSNIFSVLFNEGNKYDSSEALFRWLNSQGETKVIIKNVVEAKNNTVSSIENVINEPYVSQVTRETQVSGSSESNSPTVSFETLKTGTSLHIQPTIIRDQINLKLYMSQANLLERKSYSFDNGAIEGENLISSDKNTVIPVSIQNGQTKIITSLNQQDQRDSTKKTWLPFFGDDIDKETSEKETVIMITANLI